jgi:hypothetical protein
VIDASGTPIKKAGVWLAGWRGTAPTEAAARWEGQTPIEHVAKTTEGGEFLFESLPPDFRYEVRAHVGGSGPQRAGPVTPGPGETADVGDLAIGPGGRASGRVLDTLDRPIAGATVGALPVPREGKLEEVLPFADAESAGVAAGSDGAFLLSDVPSGRVALTADAYGFARAVQEIRVTAGGESGGLVIRLSPGGTISGKIEDPSGEEVEGALVRAEPRGSGPSFLVEADDFGEFEIDGVPENVAYRLTVEAPGSGRATAEAQAGDEEVEIRASARPSVLGEVVGAEGEEVEYALVALVPDETVWRLPIREAVGGFFRAYARDDGTFSIDVPSPGRYRVIAVAPGLTLGASPPFAVTDARVEGIRVSLHPGTEVRGVVRGGGRLLAAEVCLLQPPRPGETAPDGRGGAIPSPGNLLARATADRQGRFAFSLVPPGTYLLETTADGFAPARTPPFEIRAGQPPSETTIDLGRTGSIRGTVKGEAATLAEVKIVSFPPSGSPLEALPDVAGGFVIGEAPPGRHEVLLFPRTRPSAEFRWIDAATAAKQALAHASVDVPEGGKAEVALDPGRSAAAVVRGIVRRNGGPGSGLVVNLQPTENSPIPIGPKVSTDAEGRFSFEGVRPGPANLVVYAAPWGSGGTSARLGSLRLEVRGDQPNEVEIPLRTGRIRGRVLREDGTPAGGARVTIAPDAERGGSADLGRWVLDAAADGAFDGGEAPTGSYVLTAELLSPERQVVGSATAPIDLDPFADSVGEVRLRPPAPR